MYIKKEHFIKNISSWFFSEREERRNTARLLNLVDFIHLAKQPWMDLLGFMFRNKHVVLHYIPFTHFVLQICLTSNCTIPWLAGTTWKVLVRALLKASFFGGGKVLLWLSAEGCPLSPTLCLLFP